MTERRVTTVEVPATFFAQLVEYIPNTHKFTDPSIDRINIMFWFPHTSTALQFVVALPEAQ